MNKLSLTILLTAIFAQAGQACQQWIPNCKMTAIVVEAPHIDGYFEGHLQQLSGEDAFLNNQAVIAGNWYLPGTPAVVEDNPERYLGLLTGTAKSEPANYSVHLLPGSSVDYIIRQVAPSSVGKPLKPKPPKGKRSVVIETPGQDPGSYASLRDLTMMENTGFLAIPPASYGNFSALAGSGFILGVEGAMEPVGYHFQSLSLLGGAELRLMGPVILYVGNVARCEGLVGHPAHCDWMVLHVACGPVELAAGSHVYGHLSASESALLIRNGAIWHGSTISQKLEIEAGGGMLNCCTPEEADACPLYPIAMPADLLAGLVPPTELTDIFQGSQPGNFGWLRWSGPPSAKVLGASLTPPGDSGIYLNPNDPDDATVSVGDWVMGTPGVSNAGVVRGALDILLGRDIIVPVWDLAQGQGEGAQYRVAGFAKVRLLSYVLPKKNKITALFLGMNACGEIPSVPPVADDQVVVTEEDQPVAISLQASTPDSAPLWFLLANLPQEGWLTDAASGLPAVVDQYAPIAQSLIFTPRTNYFGTDAFQWRAFDGVLDSNTATLSIVVNPVNDPPEALSLAIATPEDTPVAFDLQGFDVEASPLAFEVVADTAHGILTQRPSGEPVSETPARLADGHLLYTPQANYSGPDVLQYNAWDGELNSPPPSASVIITVTPTPDPPVSADAGCSIDEHAIYLFSVDDFQFADPDAGDRPTGITIVTAPNPGWLFLDLDTNGRMDSGEGVTSGAFVAWSDIEGQRLAFTPAANTHGIPYASFTFSISDGLLSSAPPNVFGIDVVRLNRPPVAGSQSIIYTYNTPTPIALTAADPDQEPVTFIVQIPPVHGALRDAATGQSLTDFPAVLADSGLIYVPAPGQFADDSFSFAACDGAGATSVAVIDLTIFTDRVRPILECVEYLGPEQYVAHFGYLNPNPFPVEVPIGGDNKFTPAPQDRGQPTVFQPGRTAYYPESAFQIAFDGRNLVWTLQRRTSTASSNPVQRCQTTNNPPTAVSFQIATTEDRACVLGRELFGYADSEGDPWGHLSIESLPAKGFLFIDGNGDGQPQESEITAPDAPLPIVISSSLLELGQLHFQPAPNEFGSPYAGFLFRVFDGQDYCASQYEAAIEVTAENDPPASQDGRYTTQRNSPLVVQLEASDPEGDALSYVIAWPPRHGQLVGHGPDLTYIPDHDYVGSDSFVFNAFDGFLTSDFAVIEIEVTSVNSAPVAYFGNCETIQDMPIEFVLRAEDADGEPLSYHLTDTPRFGRVEMIVPGQPLVIYTPDRGFSGVDYLTFQARDATQSSNQALVAITVIASQAPPQAAFTANPLEGNVALEVHFDASSSIAGSAPIIHYGWDFDADGEADAAGLETDWTFETPGPHVVQLTVEDELGVSSTASQTIVAQSLPIAVAQANPAAAVGLLTATLDGSGSYSPGGQIVHYGWDIDGDGAEDLAGPVVTAQFADSGTHSVRLTVIDQWGGQASDTITLTVHAHPPRQEFAVEPPALSASLYRGERQTLAVSLLNTGETDVTYNCTVGQPPGGPTLFALASSQPETFVESLTGSLPSLHHDSLGVVFTAPHGVPAGPYNGLVTIEDSTPGGHTVVGLSLEILNLPPQVSLSEPLDQTVVVQGELIEVAAEAFDPDGVDQAVALVQLLIDDTVVQEWSTPPFLYSTSELAVGGHDLYTKAIDTDGAEALTRVHHITVVPPADCTNGMVKVEPSTISEEMPLNDNRQLSLNLRNETCDPVSCRIEVVNGTIGTTGGYVVDVFVSNPEQYWISLDPMTDEVLDLMGADDLYTVSPLVLPFSFPLFGRQWTELWISSNGLVSFGQGYSDPDNTALPNAGMGPLLAPYWDDLYPGFTLTSDDSYSTGEACGKILFHDFGTHAVVEWNNVNLSGTEIMLTFQAVIYSSGQILFNYSSKFDSFVSQSIAPSATVGIQGDALLGEAVLTAFDEPFVADAMTIRYTPSSGPFTWLEVDQPSDPLAVGESSSVPVRLRTPNVMDGPGLAGQLRVIRNDTEAEVALTDVQVNIVDARPTVHLTNPPPGHHYLAGSEIVITAEASYDRGLDRVEFFARTDLLDQFLGTATATPYSIAVTAEVEWKSIHAVAYGTDGQFTSSAPVVVYISPPIVNQPPVIAFEPSSPVSTRIANKTNRIYVSASDPDHPGGLVQRVELSVDGLLLGTSYGADSLGRYTFEWSPEQLGAHLLEAVAWDFDGASSSTEQTVLVIANQPPQIVIESPLDNQVWAHGATIPIRVQASDPEGQLISVVYLIDDPVALYPFGQGFGQPITYQKTIEVSMAPFSAELDPQTYGFHKITARATDEWGEQTVSETVVFYQGCPQPPSCDLDQDGMDDVFEIDHQLDPLVDDRMDDTDGDRFPNAFEYRHGTDPNDPDIHPVYTSAPSGGQRYILVDPAEQGVEPLCVATLQQAVAMAGPWDIVAVSPGQYRESLVIRQPLLLMSTEGAAGTILVKPGNSPRLLSLETSVVLDGLTLTTEAATGSASCHSLVSIYGQNNDTARLANLLIRDCRNWSAALLDHQSGRLHVQNCTVINNVTNTCAPAYRSGWRIPGAMENSLFWNPGLSAEIEPNGALALRHCLIRGASEFNEVGGGSRPNYGLFEAIQVADPLISPDGHLCSDSPARHSATAHLSSNFDMDGEYRPQIDQTPDIGADEFADQDADGLPDWFEEAFALTAADQDADADGLSNLDEYRYSTPPLVADSDLDGLVDSGEIASGTDPFNPDSDGDRILDGYEVTNGLNPLSVDAYADADADGFPNYYEYLSGTPAGDPASFPHYTGEVQASCRYLVAETGLSDEEPLRKRTIQAALNAAPAWSIVEVAPGSYAEILTIDKPVFLFSRAGASRTFIEAGDVPLPPAIDLRDASMAFVRVHAEAIVDGLQVRQETPGVISYPAFSIDSPECQVTIQSCRITGLASPRCSGFNILNGRVRIDHCTVDGNTSTGLVWLYASPTPAAVDNYRNCPVTILNSIFWNPGSRPEFGGDTRSISLSHCLVRDNAQDANGQPWPVALRDDLLHSDPCLRPDGTLLPDSPAVGAGLGQDRSLRDCHRESRANLTPDLGFDQWHDSDADLMPDWFENAHGLQDAEADADQDGLSNRLEFDLSWPPWEADGDGDGLNDGAEYAAGTNPFLPDTDADSILDKTELDNGLDPLANDTLEDLDRDRYPNRFEILHGSRPNDPGSVPVFGGSSPRVYFRVDPAATEETATLKRTLSAALAVADDGDIVEVRPGRYAGTFSIGQPSSHTISWFTGEENYIPWDHQRILLLSTAGPAQTVLDAAGQPNVLSVFTEAVIDGFTLTGARNLEASYDGREQMWSVPASRGGGVYVRTEFPEEAPQFLDCVVTGNRSDYGGGVAVDFGSPLFINCTIRDNESVVEATGYFENLATYSARLCQPRFVNTLFWNPSPASEVASQSVRASFAHCLFFKLPPDLSGEHLRSADPLFNHLGRLRPGSPAIDAGHPTLASAFDLDLQSRFDPAAGPAPDIGADEYRFLDADGDGLDDGWELAVGLSPADPDDAATDEDGDGLLNLLEYRHGSDPHLADTDGDGLSDFEEISLYGADPLAADSDRDSIPDGYEIAHSLDPRRDDSLEDPDRDRYPNLYEYWHDSSASDPSSIPVWSSHQSATLHKHYLVDASLAVDEEYRKKTIVAALHAAADGDLLEVLPGVYPGTLRIGHETEYHDSFLFGLEISSYAVWKSVLLISREGAARTVIDAGQAAAAITIHGQPVIDGFTITNGCEKPSLYTASYDFFVLGSFAGGLDADDSSNLLYNHQRGGAFHINLDGPYGNYRRLLSPQVNNCVIYGNTAKTGAAAYIESGRPVFTNCTIVDNRALDSDGAIIHLGYGGSYGSTGAAPLPHLTLINSILWNESYSLNQCLNAEVSIRGRTGQDLDGQFLPSYSIVRGGWMNGEGIRDQEPLLFRYHNVPASPAVDVGHPASTAPADLDLQFRDPLYASGQLADLGADELDRTDTDGDSLPDEIERLAGLDPLDPADGLPPGGSQLQSNFMPQTQASGRASLQSDPPAALDDDGGAPDCLPADPCDPDADGLSNVEEIALALDPRHPDTDLDGLADGNEIALGTNPRRPDTDRDGLPDGWEVNNGCHPLVDDSYDDNDGDRFPNLFEFFFADHSDPAGDAGADPQRHPEFPASGLNRGHFLVDPSVFWESAYVKRTLPSAIAAAPSLAIIEVLPGQYDGFEISADRLAGPPKRLFIFSRQGARQTVIQSASPDSRSVRITHAEIVFDGFTFTGQRAHLVPGSLEGVGLNRGVTINLYPGYAGHHPAKPSTFVNCVFTGHAAGDYPWPADVSGALHVVHGDVRLIHCSFINNLGRDVTVQNGALLARNSLFWADPSLSKSPIQSGSPATFDHCLVDQNPLLDVFGHLTAASPAIGAGTTIIFPPHSAPRFSDLDGESRLSPPTDLTVDIGTDEYHDADADGLLDWIENLWQGPPQSNPYADPLADADGDGLSNIDEYTIHRTDLVSPDTDGDGLDDGAEVLVYHTLPHHPDTDGDTMPDGFEVLHGLLPTDSADAMSDLDNDRYPNVYEFHFGTGPADPDSAPRPTPNWKSGDPTPPFFVFPVTGGAPTWEVWGHPDYNRMRQTTAPYSIVGIEGPGQLVAGSRTWSNPVLLLGLSASVPGLPVLRGASNAQFLTFYNTRHIGLDGLAIAGADQALTIRLSNDIKLVNCLIRDCRIALSVARCQVALESCTLFNNGFGPGPNPVDVRLWGAPILHDPVWGRPVAGDLDLRLRHTIVWNNEPLTAPDGISERPLLTLLPQASLTVENCFVRGGLADADPRDPLLDESGLLTANSPALGAAVGPGPALDLHGERRTVAGCDDLRDIGADEFHALPVLHLSANPPSGTAPLPVEFAVRAVSSACALTTVALDFGNGGPELLLDPAASIDQIVPFTYRMAGSFQAALTVTDAHGAQTAISIPIQIDNQPPTAQLTADPNQGGAPLTVTLDGSGSHDADGRIASYRFDPGDGSSPTEVSLSAGLVHLYAVPGSFLATLTVTDNFGATATATATVELPAFGPEIRFLDLPDGARVLAETPLPLRVQVTDRDSPLASITIREGPVVLASIAIDNGVVNATAGVTCRPIQTPAHGYEIELILPGPAYGTHTYTVESTDPGGLASALDLSLFAGFTDLDSDADGMPDQWEVHYGLDPFRDDAGLDSDGDGLANYLEYLSESDPSRPDTDGDGLFDGADPDPLIAATGTLLELSWVEPLASSIAQSPFVVVVAVRSDRSIASVTINGLIATSMPPSTGGTSPEYVRSVSLPAGASHLSATATTVEGRTATIVMPVSIDRLPPRIQFVDPQPGQVKYAHHARVEVLLESEDGAVTIADRPASRYGNKAAAWVPLLQGRNEVEIRFDLDGRSNVRSLFLDAQSPLWLAEDWDFDDDGLENANDLFPADPSEGDDLDGDGTGDGRDPDPGNPSLSTVHPIF